jgi:hypothetical protein
VEHQLPLPLFWVQGHFGAFWLGLPAKGGIQRVVGEGKGGGRGNITLVTLVTVVSVFWSITVFSLFQFLLGIFSMENVRHIQYGEC